MDNFYGVGENSELVKKNHYQLINNVIKTIEENNRKRSTNPSDDHSGELKEAALWLFPEISKDNMLAWNIFEDEDNNFVFASTCHGWTFWICLYKEHGFVKIYIFVQHSSIEKSIIDDGIDFIVFDKVPTEYPLISKTVELYSEFSNACLNGTAEDDRYQ